MSSPVAAFDTGLLTRDARETLLYLRKPGSIAALAERLGLSGSYEEVAALCDSISLLAAVGLVELDPTPGFATYRYRRTQLGYEVAGADE